MSSSMDSKSDLVWLSPDQLMPNVCCTCGMFTDQRVKVKHVHTQSVPKSVFDVDITLIDVVFHFLGPLGWLIGAMAKGKNNKGEFKTVKHKSIIRISQCRLCAEMTPPEVMEARRTPLLLAFRTHPEFAKMLYEINATSAEGDALKT